jgi:hypothetical protein
MTFPSDLTTVKQELEIAATRKGPALSQVCIERQALELIELLEDTVAAQREYLNGKVRER